MPDAVIVVWFGVLGAIIGSFLNVVIYRMHTGRSVNGRSRCLSCGATLGALELVPIVSYLALRGRCAHCSARISPRYALVELSTALLFALMAYLEGDMYLRLLYAALMATFVVIVVYDLVHTIIPDEWVVGASSIVAFITVAEWAHSGDEMAVLLRLGAAAFGFAFFGGLWLVSKGRWIGLGDAKLAIPLGAMVSWPAVISALILSFWIGAIISVALLLVSDLLRRGQGRLPFLRAPLTMKSEVPFAPFLVLGFVLAHFTSFDAFTFVQSLLP